MNEDRPLFSNLKCRECGRLYGKEAIHICEYDFGPLEAAYDYEAIRKRISREIFAARPQNMWRYRELLPIDGAPTVGAGCRIYAASEDRPPRKGPWGLGALHQERHGQLPHPVFQGPCRLSGPEPRARTRIQSCCVRLHRQPRQFGCRQCRGGGPEELCPDSCRLGAEQSSRLSGLWHPRYWDPRPLRSSQQALLGDCRQVWMGVRQRQPASLLRRGIKEHGLRNRRAAWVENPAPHNRADGQRFAADKDPQSIQGIHPHWHS